MKAVVFFDLDGVLADFVASALAVHGATLPVSDVTWGFPAQIGFSGVDDPKFWEPLGYDFWAGLGVYADGLCLLRAAERLVGVERIGLLTSPCNTPGCVEGKRSWVARHLPDYSRRLFVGSAKELFAGPGKVLVDDYDGNTERFSRAGGRYVLPPRPWNTLKSYCDARGHFSVPTTFETLSQEVVYANRER